MIDVSQELKDYEFKKEKEEEQPEEENFTQIFGKKNQIANLNQKTTSKEKQFYTKFEQSQHQKELEQREISKMNLPIERIQEHKDREKLKYNSQIESTQSSNSKSKLHVVNYVDDSNDQILNQKSLKVN